MNHGPEFSKWSELRAKTDRELIAIVGKSLTNGLRLAREAAESGSRQSWAGARQSYTDARRLFPCLGDVTILERRRLERELAQLGRRLEEFEMDVPRVSAVCG